MSATQGFYAPGSFLMREPLKLDFARAKHKGLEVTARAVPLGLLRDAASVTGALGRSLVSWNVRDDNDRPVPATASGLASRDPELIAAVSGAYLKAVGAIGRPVPIPAAASPRVVPPTRKPSRGRAKSRRSADETRGVSQ